MRDVEVVLECLRIASEDVEVFDPVSAVDRALVGLQSHRKDYLRPEFIRLLRAYEVSSMDDLRRVYMAQKRAHEAQQAPALSGKTGNPAESQGGKREP